MIVNHSTRGMHRCDEHCASAHDHRSPTEVPMGERQVRVGSKVGLHARPASLFAKAVKDTGLPVRIAKEGGSPVDARSLLNLLTLGAGHDELVTLSAEG